MPDSFEVWSEKLLDNVEKTMSIYVRDGVVEINSMLSSLLLSLMIHRRRTNLIVVSMSTDQLDKHEIEMVENLTKFVWEHVKPNNHNPHELPVKLRAIS